MSNQSNSSSTGWFFSFLGLLAAIPQVWGVLATILLWPMGVCFLFVYYYKWRHKENTYEGVFYGTRLVAVFFGVIGGALVWIYIYHGFHGKPLPDWVPQFFHALNKDDTATDYRYDDGLLACILWIWLTMASFVWGREVGGHYVPWNWVYKQIVLEQLAQELAVIQSEDPTKKPGFRNLPRDEQLELIENHLFRLNKNDEKVETVKKVF